jgi:hypothetical protein
MPGFQWLGGDTISAEVVSLPSIVQDELIKGQSWPWLAVDPIEDEGHRGNVVRRGVAS